MKLNLIVGKGITGVEVLWFHFNLIILSILFFIFSFLVENFFLSFFQIIASISLIIQYSEMHYKLLNEFRIIIAMPIGNLVETLTLAIFSFSISHINYFKLISKSKKKFILFCCFFLYIIFYYNVFSPLHGYSSSGIKQNIVAFFLFNIFFLLNFESINLKVLVVIEQTTKYTQGIYCLHFLIQYYVKLIFDKKGSFFGCIFLSLFPK